MVQNLSQFVMMFQKMRRLLLYGMPNLTLQPDSIMVIAVKKLRAKFQIFMHMIFTCIRIQKKKYNCICARVSKKVSSFIITITNYAPQLSTVVKITTNHSFQTNSCRSMLYSPLWLRTCRRKRLPSKQSLRERRKTERFTSWNWVMMNTSNHSLSSTATETLDLTILN